ncbi:hypothetical protein [Oceanibacterium hippocampi]|uniref:Uncharacterized protein n=1 Tax=Oceanibacterium hippocampi TaxID=745714 RepID=A0A1Y5U2W3_9PROT|nr:hypothetical protein [Oceanibacterium hippocampi]SLN77538.1 hypothetical protein OCH7691_04450 [Oceanibacterium hippocampi]
MLSALLALLSLAALVMVVVAAIRPRWAWPFAKAPRRAPVAFGWTGAALAAVLGMAATVTPIEPPTPTTDTEVPAPGPASADENATAAPRTVEERIAAADERIRRVTIIGPDVVLAVDMAPQANHWQVIDRLGKAMRAAIPAALEAGGADGVLAARAVIDGTDRNGKPTERRMLGLILPLVVAAEVDFTDIAVGRVVGLSTPYLRGPDDLSMASAWCADPARHDQAADFCARVRHFGSARSFPGSED